MCCFGSYNPSLCNKQVFGRVDHIISELQERVEILEESLQVEFSDEVERDFLESNIELAKWQKREEIRPTQVAKNRKNFHVVIAQHRRNRMLDQMILENGIRLSSPQQIHMEAVRYFENFLTEEYVRAIPNLSTLIDNTVIEVEG